MYTTIIECQEMNFERVYGIKIPSWKMTFI